MSPPCVHASRSTEKKILCVPDLFKSLGKKVVLLARTRNFNIAARRVTFPINAHPRLKAKMWKRKIKNGLLANVKRQKPRKNAIHNTRLRSDELNK